MNTSIILFSSKKGTAERVATYFGETLNIDVVGVKFIDPEILKNYKNVIFVVANYGKAEAPPQDMIFWNKLFEMKQTDSFAGLNFAVFGCGSSKRAPYYQGFAKMVIKHLNSTGAHQIAELGERDAAIDDESSVQTWPLQLKL